MKIIYKDTDGLYKLERKAGEFLLSLCLAIDIILVLLFSFGILVIKLP